MLERTVIKMIAEIPTFTQNVETECHNFLDLCPLSGCLRSHALIHNHLENGHEEGVHNKEQPLDLDVLK